MNKKGFTLIELLAVIVILGVILVIAIPSISAAILNARKNSYVATANEFVDGVRIASLTDPTILPGGDDTEFISIADIKLEKGSKTKSPFGKAYIEGSGVYINYDATNDKYIYSICLVDENNNGINLEDIINVDKSDVKIGSATCDGSSSGGGSGGEDDPVIGSTSDWLVSDEPNETGGYTLLGFKHDIQECGHTRMCDNITVDKGYYNDSNNLYYCVYHYETIQCDSSMINKDAYTINIPNTVKIPDTDDYKTITELGGYLFSAVYFTELSQPAFKEPYMRIRKVVIPEGIIKTYGIVEGDSETESGGFMYNLSLKEVELPSSLTVIGAYTFYLNPSLNETTLPPNLTEIGNYAFVANRISSLTIPASVKSIGDFAFANRGTLNTLTFEGANDGTSQLETIGKLAFFNQWNIQTLVIPASVNIIDDEAFYTEEDNPHNLTSLTFIGADNGTSGLNTIGKRAFKNNNLSTVIIPASVETIRDWAFIKGDPYFTFNPWISITVKRFDSSGMTLGTNWHGGANVIWAGN